MLDRCRVGNIFTDYVCVYSRNGHLRLGCRLLEQEKMMTSIPKLITSGIIIALLGVVLSSPITALVFGGITETGQGVIITFLRATGLGVLPATLISSFCTEFLDKLLSCVVCYIIVKGMSNRYLSKFKLGHIYLKEKKEKNDLFDDDDIADENTDKNTDSGEPQ